MGSALCLRRGRALPCARGTVVCVARIEVRLQLGFSEMLEMLGLAEQVPALQGTIGRLLTAEGRHCSVSTNVLHEKLPPGDLRLIAPVCVTNIARARNICGTAGCLYESVNQTLTRTGRMALFWRKLKTVCTHVSMPINAQSCDLCGAHHSRVDRSGL